MNIFIGPESCTKLEKVKFPHVKNPKEPQFYLYDEENLTLYEATKFADQYKSWFVDNLLDQDGHINFLTRVNPLFIFLPQLMRFAGEQFRTLHDLCQTFGSTPESQNFSRLDYALSPDIDWSKVCDTRDIDDELFVRYSETKTLDWLVRKQKQTVAALAEELGPQASRATLISYANDLIDLYIPTSLTEKFKATVRNDASLSSADTLDKSLEASKTTPKFSASTKRTAPVGDGGGSSRPAFNKMAASMQQRPKQPEPKKGGMWKYIQSQSVGKNN